MKFLCDHMLIHLGKWLRAAGHDTLIITPSISDHEVLSLAIATGGTNLNFGKRDLL